jgi:cysteinyl-tRNA synthetase
LHIGVALKTFKELAGVLGLTLQPELIEPDIPLNLMLELAEKHNVVLKESNDITSIISRFSEKRLELRRSKKWQLADSIRNDLKELGIALEDTPQGTVWRYRKP